MRYVELSVGTFMVMGIIALVLMAFRVSGLSMDASGETYTLKARFQNLGGLTERAKVSMAGVTIGKVTDIYLDDKYYEAVVVFTDAFGRRYTIVTAEHRDPGNHQTKRRRLDQAFDHVFVEGHRVLHIAPVGTVVQAEQVDRNKRAAPDTHGTEQQRQYRHTDDARPQSGGNHAFERVNPHHFHGG